jgi:hypothetical protein
MVSKRIVDPNEERYFAHDAPEAAVELLTAADEGLVARPGGRAASCSS